MSGWWFQPTPLKNDGVRQLGLLFPIWKVIKFHGSKPPTRCHIIDPSHRHWPVQTAFYDVLCGFNPPKTIRCWYVPRHLAALIWMLPPYVPLQCEAILLIGKPDNFAEFVASDSTEPWENHHFSRPLPWTSCPCQAYLLWTYHLPCHVAAFNRALKLPKSHTAVLDSEARQTCGQSRSVLYVSKTPWQLAIHSICGICLISFFFGSSTEWQPPETLDELGASAAQEMLPQHCWIWRGCQSLPAVFPSAEPRTVGFWVPKYHVVNPYEPDIYIYIYIMNIRFGMVSIPPISIPPWIMAKNLLSYQLSYRISLGSPPCNIDPSHLAYSAVATFLLRRYFLNRAAAEP